MRRTTMLIAVSVLLLAVACGADQEVVTGDTDPSGSDLPESGRPGGPVADLVVSVDVGGGFLPRGQSFRTVPQAVVYEDGTTLAPGATITIYPAPALPAVTKGRVDGDMVEQLVAAAADAGLLDENEEDFGEPTIADAATTTITVVADGKTHVTSVYALDGLGGLGPMPAGVTTDQQQARDRVSDFVQFVSRTVVGAGGEPYVAERYRLLPLAPDQEVDLAVEPDTRDWPFPDVALQEGECTAVSGEQADELHDALASASEITRWRTASGQTFVLSVRPVLPHEPACPE